jgi:hypothetical protein
MLFKRILAMFALAFGFLGVLACLAGFYAVWLLGSRLEQANERVFSRIDQGLASVQDLVGRVQKRVQEAKITTAEVDQKLRDWTKRKATERLVSRLEIESRAEKLSGHLQTADSWLQTSTETIRGIQHILELGKSLGAPLDPAALEEVFEKLTAVRGTLQKTEQSVDRIREFSKEPEENRLPRIVKLVARTLLTMSEVDTRLENSVTRLAELQTDAQELKARTSNFIFVRTMACYLILAWMAVGQAALCLCGWTNCCRSRSSA